MTGKTSELQFHEREIIEQMLKLPKTKTGTIAVTLERSHSCIKQEIRKNGGRAAYKAREAQERTELRRRAGALKKTKPLPEYLRPQVISMLEAGESMNAIYKATGIKSYRLRTYMRDNNIKVRNHSNKSILDRLDLIEQQLEIIFEIIKQKES